MIERKTKSEAIRLIRVHAMLRNACQLFVVLIFCLLSFDIMSQNAPPPAPPGAPVTPAAPADSSGTIIVEESASEDEAPPAPKYGPNGELLIRVNFISTPIERVVADISKKSGASIISRGKTAGQRVSVNAKDESVERVLDKLTNSQSNWLWTKAQGKSNTYEIWDSDSYKLEVLPKMVRQKVFQPREIPAEEVNKAIQPMLTEGIGTSSFDPRSNKVIVTDLPRVLELIQRMLDQIDVKLYTRVFYIEHADVNSIAEKLGNVKSSAAPAPEVDERTRQIIVKDRLEIVSQMASLVETLDIGPEMRVYDLNNIGIENEHVEDLEDAISELVTEGAYYKINSAAAKLIVQDVPSVHEKIEAVLAAFDQPQKQVNVEMEVVETYLEEGFEYSVDYNFSNDLFAAALDGLLSGVPYGSGVKTDGNLGFLNISHEFPAASGGSSGLDINYLSSHWFIKLHALQEDGKARVLQQPRVLVKNKDTVIFRVGNRLPYMTGGYGSTYNSSTGTYTNSGGNVQFIDDGLELEVTPIISNNGMIEIDLTVNNRKAELKTITYQSQDNTAPQTKTQELGTTLLIPSGETRVVGGLIQESEAETHGGIPYLVKIPKIGPLLFGKVSKPRTDNLRKNLLIFITPTVVVDKPGDLLKYQGRVIQAREKDFDKLETSLADASASFENTPSDMTPNQVPLPFWDNDTYSTDYVSNASTTTEKPDNAQPTWPTDSSDSSESIDDYKSEISFEDLPHVIVDDGVTTGALASIEPTIKGPSGNLTSTDSPNSSNYNNQSFRPGNVRPSQNADQRSGSVDSNIRNVRFGSTRGFAGSPSRETRR